MGCVCVCFLNKFLTQSIKAIPTYIYTHQEFNYVRNIYILLCVRVPFHGVVLSSFFLLIASPELGLI